MTGRETSACVIVISIFPISRSCGTHTLTGKLVGGGGGVLDVDVSVPVEVVPEVVPVEADPVAPVTGAIGAAYEEPST